MGGVVVCPVLPRLPVLVQRRTAHAPADETLSLVGEQRCYCRGLTAVFLPVGHQLAVLTRHQHPVIHQVRDQRAFPHVCQYGPQLAAAVFGGAPALELADVFAVFAVLVPSESQVVPGGVLQLIGQRVRDKARSARAGLLRAGYDGRGLIRPEHARREELPRIRQAYFNLRFLRRVRDRQQDRRLTVSAVGRLSDLAEVFLIYLIAALNPAHRARPPFPARPPPVRNSCRL